MNKTKPEKIIAFVKDMLREQHIEGLESVYVFSSLSRGDFIEGKSDIDLLFIYTDKTPLEQMEKGSAFFANELETKCGKSKTDVRVDFVDILFVQQKDIPRTKEASFSSRFSAFSLFGFDLKNSNTLVFGEDMLKFFTPTEAASLVNKKLSEWVKRSEDNPSDSTLMAGQSLRAIAIKAGATSLSKDHIIETLLSSNLPDWITAYAKTHYAFCYQNNASSPTTCDESYSFMQKVKEAYSK